MTEKDIADKIKRRVAKLYWEDDKNCATTVLSVLAEIFGIELFPQTMDAALAMHGAGKYGAQCGLIEGAIMFMGIFARKNEVKDSLAIDACREFAETFEARFGSLLCKVLRPAGFVDDNPPHLCEKFTCEAIELTVGYIMKFQTVTLGK